MSSKTTSFEVTRCLVNESTAYSKPVASLQRTAVDPRNLLLRDKRNAEVHSTCARSYEKTCQSVR